MDGDAAALEVDGDAAALADAIKQYGAFSSQPWALFNSF